MATRQDEIPSLVEAGHELRDWFATLTPKVVLAAVVVTIGVVAQMAAFWYGFGAAAGEPPDVSRAKLLAGGGLLAAFVVILLLAEALRHDWLSQGAVTLFLGLGAIAGAIVAWNLPSETGGLLGYLFLYKGLILSYGGPVCVVLPIAGVIGRAFERAWWRLAMAAPVLMMTGAHAVLLMGLYLQAPEIATADPGFDLFG